jgi:hypothetical protein
MTLYEKETPDVEITITGTIGLAISVKNIGTNDILYVDWSSRLTGGFLLSPSERTHHGTVLYLAQGQELVIQKVGVLFGFGVIEVNVTVGKTTDSVRGLLFLFLFVPVSK